MATIGTTAANVELTIEQGGDVFETFGLKDSTGTLIDTASYRAIAKVRATYGGPVLLELSTTTRPDGTTGNGRVTTGIQGTAPNQWNVQFTVDHGATTALVDWNVGIWDLILADTFGNRTVVMKGPAVLSRSASI